MRYKLLIILVICGCVGDLAPDIPVNLNVPDFLIDLLYKGVSDLCAISSFVVELCGGNYVRCIYGLWIHLLEDVLLPDLYTIVFMYSKFVNTFNSYCNYFWDFMFLPIAGRVLGDELVSVILLYFPYMTSHAPYIWEISFRGGVYFYSERGMMRRKVYVSKVRSWGSTFVLANIHRAASLVPPG